MAQQPADDFDQQGWHDNLVCGMRFRSPDPDRDDWRSELELDIDHIVEWIGPEGADKHFRFRVAPATLTFHDVTDLKVAINPGSNGGQWALNQPDIDFIERQRVPVADQKICLDRPYYRWRIALILPTGDGEIAFGASGYTQTLRAEPVLTDRQSLPAGSRANTL